MADQSYEQAFQEWLNSQSGYVGKSKKAQFAENWQTQQENGKNLNNIFSGDKTQFSVSGSAQEQKGRIEGLARAKILTGQDPYQIGADYQQAYGNIKKRAEGSDTASELLRANKAGAVSDVRNSMRAQGVKGGAAAGAAASVERQKAYDVGNQLIQNQKQAQNDYLNATKANANFTQASEMNYGMMALGKDVQAPAQNSNGFGNFGTVICTELYRQGFMTRKTYLLDVKYGMEMLSERPDIYWGYRYLANPVVEMMKMSPLFTRLVSIVLTPWAKHMAGEKNVIGAMTEKAGMFICGLVGRNILGVERYAKA